MYVLLIYIFFDWCIIHSSVILISLFTLLIPHYQDIFFLSKHILLSDNFFKICFKMLPLSPVFPHCQFQIMFPRFISKFLFFCDMFWLWASVLCVCINMLVYVFVCVKGVGSHSVFVFYCTAFCASIFLSKKCSTNKIRLTDCLIGSDCRQAPSFATWNIWTMYRAGTTWIIAD